MGIAAGLADLLKRLIVTALLGLLVGWIASERASALDLDVVGTAFRVTADGRVFEGADLVDAVLTIAFDGAPVRARIASVVPDPARPSVLLHDLQVVGDDGVERPLCNEGPDGLRLGFPIRGRTDATGALRAAEPGAFEFVCTAGAQGKCVRFGYDPWGSAADGAPMLDHFNACVRMVRADYCGDGRTFTRDGTLIGFGDSAGVNTFDPAGETVRLEAAWGSEGAVCVARTRLEDVVSRSELTDLCPRLAGAMSADCSLDTPGALILNHSR